MSFFIVALIGRGVRFQKVSLKEIAKLKEYTE